MSSSKDILDRETDARFWAQTQYKIGQKLDPKDPADRKMVKVWMDIFAKVQREDRRGELVLTYNHPQVEQHLADATAASDATRDHLEKAAASPDQTEAQPYLDAAARSATSMAESAQAAAMRQPPTVSPVVVQAAAQEVARDAGTRPPPAAVQTLSDDHPAVSSPAAAPAISPGMATAMDAIAQESDRDARGGGSSNARDRVVELIDRIANGRTPDAAAPAPQRAPDPIAVAQATAAPQVAVAVHEAARALDAAGYVPESSLHPQTVDQIRTTASKLADLARDFRVVGVIYLPNERWDMRSFADVNQAADWYGQAVDAPDNFKYVAYFDRDDATSWPKPVNEVLGSGRAIDVRVQVERAPAPPAPPVAVAPAPRKDDAMKGLAIAAGIGAFGLLCVSLMSKRR